MWVFIRKTNRNCTGRICHGSSEGQGAGGSRVRWEGLCRGLRRGRKATHAVPAPWSRPAQPPPPRLECCPALWADSRRHSPTICVRLLWKSPESQKNVQWSECAEAAAGSKHRTPSPALLDPHLEGKGTSEQGAIALLSGLGFWMYRSSEGSYYFLKGFAQVSTYIETCW